MSIPYQSDFAAATFRSRWQKIFDKMGPDAVAVIQGAPMTTGYSMPRQYNEFYYLCGVETPHSYLLLDGRTRRVTLYLPNRDPKMESVEGKSFSAEDGDFARNRIGVDEVQSTDVLAINWLRTLPDGVPKRIFTLLAPSERNTEGRYELHAANSAIAVDPWDSRLPREAVFAGLLRARYPKSEIVDLTPTLDELRSVKGVEEISLIRQASQIAGIAQIEAIRATRPGLYEYHLDAVARYVFLINDCRLEAYRSITACGTKNILNMHYFRNDGPLIEGELVLMDYAPEYRYYASDVTRMWPVGGTFTAWQRDLLQFVLDYRNAIMARIEPGRTAKDIQLDAAKGMEPVFERTTFSKPIYEQAARRLVETGGGVFSHPVGLAVHDDGRYDNGPLVPGHVFSIDPQLRVPEENLYIRYEDTIAVTEGGCENFTDFVPSELDDIEALMREDGLVQKTRLRLEEFFRV